MVILLQILVIAFSGNITITNQKICSELFSKRSTSHLSSNVAFLTNQGKVNKTRVYSLSFSALIA